MSLVINTNSAATVASQNLQNTNALLQKSLNRLSSGMKINTPAEDAGGLAVSMKLEATIKRTNAINTNIQNAISFLQSQDGGFKLSSDLLNRISELKVFSLDVTKSASDVANYETEYDELKSQLSNLISEKFNGVSLFGGSNVSVATTEDGSVNVNITKADLANAFNAITSAANLNDISVANVTNSIQSIATLRATNGAQTSRLEFASRMLDINQSNLEAANSRIIDTDIADESTKFARYQILTQSGAAMLAQANTTPQIALRLLQ